MERDYPVMLTPDVIIEIVECKRVFFSALGRVLRDDQLYRPRVGAGDVRFGMEKIPTLVAFLMDVERLKLVERKAYVSDTSRRENSAEHSWHLSIGLLALAEELNLKIDLHKALVMALIHDVCEIDAGDTPAFGPQRPDQYEAELRCIESLAGYDLKFAPSIRELWLEYEAQVSAESRWVKVLDLVMPFIVNLATQGINWKEQSVSRSQVLRVSEPVREHAPEIYQWMLGRVQECVKAGWLIDA
jgi:putative hydrolase of HD superfamily